MNGKRNTPFGKLGVISMRGCEALAKMIDEYLREWDIADGGHGESFLVKSSCPRFATGEAKGMLEQSVRGYDLYILCDVFNYNVKYEMYGQENAMSPDDHYADLKRIIGATNGKARRLNVIMPMLYEGRQHRRFTRESLDCALTLQELQRMGITNIITFDAHDPRVQNAIPLIGFENVPPTYHMIRELIRTVPDITIDKDNLMMVSPDEGGMPRGIYYASVMELELGMFYKRRDYTRLEKGRNPIVRHEFLGESPKGKDIIVVDDMISSGESILSVATQLKKLGARRIFVFACFGLFCEGLEGFDQAYRDKLIDKVYTTNLIYQPEALLKKDWYRSVSMSKYISYIVSQLNCDHSISDLLNPQSRIKRVLTEARGR